MIGNVWATRRIGVARRRTTLSLWSMCAGIWCWPPLVLRDGRALCWVHWPGVAACSPAIPRSRRDWWPPRRARWRQHRAQHQHDLSPGRQSAPRFGGAVIAGSSYSTLPVVGAVVLLAALALSWRRSGATGNSVAGTRARDPPHRSSSAANPLDLIGLQRCFLAKSIFCVSAFEALYNGTLTEKLLSQRRYARPCISSCRRTVRAPSV